MHAQTCQRKTLLRKMADMMVEKNGSAAFTMCVNDTAPAPKDTTVMMWPVVCIRAMGAIALASSQLILGALRICGSNTINRRKNGARGRRGEMSNHLM